MANRYNWNLWSGVHIPLTLTLCVALSAVLCSCVTREQNKGLASAKETKKAAVDSLFEKMRGSSATPPFPVAVIGKVVITQSFSKAVGGLPQREEFQSDNASFLSGDAAGELHDFLYRAATFPVGQSPESYVDDPFEFVGCQLTQLEQLSPLKNSPQKLLARVGELLRPNAASFFQVDEPALGGGDLSLNDCGKRRLRKTGRLTYEFYLDEAENGDLHQMVVLTEGPNRKAAVFRKRAAIHQNEHVLDAQSGAAASRPYEVPQLSRELPDDMVLLVTRPNFWDQKTSRRLLFPLRKRFDAASSEEFKRWAKAEIAVEVQREDTTDEGIAGETLQLKYGNKALFALGMNQRLLRDMNNRFFPEKDKDGNLGKSTAAERTIWQSFQAPQSLIEISDRAVLMEHFKKMGLAGVKTGYGLLFVSSGYGMVATASMVHGALVPAAQAAVYLQFASQAGFFVRTFLDVSGLTRMAQVTPKKTLAHSWILATGNIANIFMAAGSGLGAAMSNEALVGFITQSFHEGLGAVVMWSQASGADALAGLRSFVQQNHDNIAAASAFVAKTTADMHTAFAEMLSSPAVIRTTQSIGSLGQNAFGNIVTFFESQEWIERLVFTDYREIKTGRLLYCPSFAVGGFALGGLWRGCIAFMKSTEEWSGWSDARGKEVIEAGLDAASIRRSISQCGRHLQEHAKGLQAREWGENDSNDRKEKKAAQSPKQAFCKVSGRSCLNACSNAVIPLFKSVWQPEFYRCLALQSSTTEREQNCILKHGSSRTNAGRELRLKTVF